LIWQRKYFVIWGIGIGLIIAILLSLLLKPQYEASMIIAPPLVDSRTNSFVDGVMVYAPDVTAHIPTGNPEFIRFEQSLRGVAVASLLFQMDDVANKVSEGTIWRGVSQHVKSPENLSLILQNEIQIETIGVTASRKITYRHPDPKFAVKLLVLLRKADDQIIRTSIKAETENKIEWLKTEFQKTLNPDHRNALVQLLMSEERRRMLLSLETPYAVNVVEEASASPKPVTPNRPFIFLMMCLVGGFCGSVAALILGQKSQ
jgi:uncharacterized protein involved in exopolysaccharide biosynthesis